MAARHYMECRSPEGLSWPFSGPLTPGGALEVDRTDARRPLREHYTEFSGVRNYPQNIDTRPNALPLGAADVETAARRLETAHRAISATKVIEVIIIQRRFHGERASPGLGGGPDHCNQYITRVPGELWTRGPGERPACVVPGIREGLLPAPRKLRLDVGEAQQEHPWACLAILYRTRPCTRQIVGRITVGTAQNNYSQGHCTPPWSPLHGTPFSRPRVHSVPRAYPKTSAHSLAACGLPV
jgi:hypothetical protein